MTWTFIYIWTPAADVWKDVFAMPTRTNQLKPLDRFGLQRLLGLITVESPKIDSLQRLLGLITVVIDSLQRLLGLITL